MIDLILIAAAVVVGVYVVVQFVLPILFFVIGFVLTTILWVVGAAARSTRRRIGR